MRPNEMKGQIGPVDRELAARGGDDGFRKAPVVVPGADKGATSLVGDGGKRRVNLDRHTMAFKSALGNFVHTLGDLLDGIAQQVEFSEVVFDNFSERARVVAKETAGDELGRAQKLLKLFEVR